MHKHKGRKKLQIVIKATTLKHKQLQSTINIKNQQIPPKEQKNKKKKMIMENSPTPQSQPWPMSAQKITKKIYENP